MQKLSFVHLIIHALLIQKHFRRFLQGLFQAGLVSECRGIYNFYGNIFKEDIFRTPVAYLFEACYETIVRDKESRLCGLWPLRGFQCSKGRDKVAKKENGITCPVILTKLHQLKEKFSIPAFPIFPSSTHDGSVLQHPHNCFKISTFVSISIWPKCQRNRANSRLWIKRVQHINKKARN